MIRLLVLLLLGFPQSSHEESSKDFSRSSGVNIKYSRDFSKGDYQAVYQAIKEVFKDFPAPNPSKKIIFEKMKPDASFSLLLKGKYIKIKYLASQEKKDEQLIQDIDKIKRDLENIQ